VHPQALHGAQAAGHRQGSGEGAERGLRQATASQVGRPHQRLQDRVQGAPYQAVRTACIKAEYPELLNCPAAILSFQGGGQTGGRDQHHTAVGEPPAAGARRVTME
jgi:hypothetical protein